MAGALAGVTPSAGMHCVRIKVDDFRRVLDDFIVRRLEQGLLPVPHPGRRGRETRMPGFTLDEAELLLAQVAPDLAGVERELQSVEDVGAIGHAPQRSVRASVSARMNELLDRRHEDAGFPHRSFHGGEG